MTDQDQHPATRFSTALRGYNPVEVDRYVALLNRQIEELERERSELLSELEQLRSELREAVEAGGGPGGPATAPPVRPDDYEQRLAALDALLVAVAGELARRVGVAQAEDAPERLPQQTLAPQEALDETLVGTPRHEPVVPAADEHLAEQPDEPADEPEEPAEVPDREDTVELQDAAEHEPLSAIDQDLEHEDARLFALEEARQSLARDEVDELGLEELFAGLESVGASDDDAEPRRGSWEPPAGTDDEPGRRDFVD